MSNPAEVAIYSLRQAVRIYTHWDAETLPRTVQIAVQRFRARWGVNDPEYLAAVVFANMLDGRSDKITGLGISAGDKTSTRQIRLYPRTLRVSMWNGKIKLWAGSFHDYAMLETVPGWDKEER